MDQYSVEAILSVVGADKFKGAFDNAAKSIQNLQKASSKVRDVGKRIGSVGDTLTSKITKPALTATAAVAGIVGALGFKRLVGIDTARAQLKGLGHDGKTIESIMDSALKSVKGTSFGLDEAATTAANAVAAGVKEGEELTRYLTLTGDAAAIANIGLGEMGSILNKVTTSNKAYNGELRQLADRGLPVYEWLADEANTTSDAIFDMASSGAISTEMLLNAIENNIGGAAAIMGAESFTAAWANMWAAVGRLGAAFLDAGGKGGGFFSQLKPLMADFTERIDNMGGLAEDLGVRFGQAFSNMVDKVKELKQKYDDLSPAQQDLINKIAMIAPVVAVGLGPALKIIGAITTGFGFLLNIIPMIAGGFEIVGGAIAAMTGPVGLTIAAIVAIGAALVVAYNKSETFRDVVHTVFNFVKDVVTDVISVVSEYVLEKWAYLVDWWEENNELIKSSTDKVWKAIQGIIKVVMEFIVPLIKDYWNMVKINTEMVWDFIKLFIDNALVLITGIIKTAMQIIDGDWSGAWKTIKETLKTMWDNMKDFLSKTLKNIVKLTKERFENIKGTIKDKITQAKDAFVKKLGEMVASMINKGAEVVNSAKDKFEEVKQAVKDKMKDAVKALADKVAEMPGKVREKVSDMIQAGKDLVAGLIKGIEDKVSDATGAIGSLVGKVISTAKAKLDSHSPSRVFIKIGEDTGDGLAIGIRNKEKLVDSVTKRLVDQITSTAKQSNKQIQAVNKKYRAEEKALEKRANEDINLIHAKAKQAKRKLTQAESIRISRIEEKLQKDIKNLHSKAAKDIEKIEKDKSKKMDAIRAAEFKKSQEWIDYKKDYQGLALKEELEDWERVQARYAKGTKEREEAEKNVHRVKQAIHDKLTNLNDEYLKQVQDINQKLIDEENKLNEEYQKAVDDRTKSLYSFVGIFDEISEKADVSGQQLISNLKDQVDTFADWSKNIKSLAERGIDEGLLAELREMGPKAAAEIRALNSLSDDQLSEYVGLWQQKNSMAREQAINELEGMKQDTQKKIEELHKQTESQLDSLEKEWVSKINEIRYGTKEEFSVMKSDLKTIGEQSIKGMINGLEAMRPALMAKAQSIANAVKATIQSALDIHSPSRWMRDMIGKNMMLGWIDGIESMKGQALLTMNDAVGWMTPNVPQVQNGINRNHNAIGGLGGGITQHITINSPKHLSPSETARRQKQASRQLATEWSV